MDVVDYEDWSDVAADGPHDPVMFKSCSVCNKQADSGIYFHSHYGAVCCNGCRLFFHRVQSQVSEGYNLKCKGGGRCSSTSRGKRWCLKCRFEKCLQVGMDPKKRATHKLERKMIMKNYRRRASIGTLDDQMSASSTEEVSDQPFSSEEEGARDVFGNYNYKMEEDRELYTNGAFDNFQDFSGQRGLYSRAPDFPWCQNHHQEYRDKSEFSCKEDSITHDLEHSEEFKGQQATNEREVEYGLNQTTTNSPRITPPFKLFCDSSRRFQSSLLQSTSTLSPYKVNNIFEMAIKEEGLSEKFPETRVSSSKDEKFWTSLSQRSSFQMLIIQALDSFSLSTSKMNLTRGATKHIINCHQGSEDFNKTFFISHLIDMLQLISQFTLTQSHFISLCPEDQRTLQKNNLQLYLQYIIARYFCAESGMEQLSWLLEGHIPCQSIEEIQRLKFVEYDEINGQTSLLGLQAASEKYKHLLKQVGISYPFPSHYNPLLVNALLYYTDDTMTLKESRRIQTIFEEGKRVIKRSQSLLDSNHEIPGLNNLDDLIQQLRTMSMIFEKSFISVQQSNSITESVPKFMDIPYTDVEELWLHRQFGSLQDNYKSVHIPVSFLQEYIELLGGVDEKKPSRSFMDTWLRMSKERVRRVLEIHSEFTDLPLQYQNKLWIRNHMTAVALTGVLLNTALSGKEQFKGILGHLGKEESWEEPFNDVLDLEKLRPVQLAQINKNILDDESMKYFASLVTEISKLVSNDQLFQIMMLVVLLDFDLSDSGVMQELVKVRQHYLKLFQRKLFSVKCSFIEYSHFHKAVKKLKIFAKMLELFFS